MPPTSEPCTQKNVPDFDCSQNATVLADGAGSETSMVCVLAVPGLPVPTGPRLN